MGGVDTSPVVGVKDEVTGVKVTQGESQILGFSFLSVGVLNGARKLLGVN